MQWLPWSINASKTAQKSSLVQKPKKIKPVNAPSPLNSSRRLPQHGRDCNEATKKYNPFHLLSLPAHVRAQIIRLIVVLGVADAPITENGKIIVDASDQKLCEQPGIAMTCRDMRMEALPIFLCENHFMVEVRSYNIEPLLKWWKMVQSLRNEGVIAQFSKTVDGVTMPEVRMPIAYRHQEKPRDLGKDSMKACEGEKDEVDFLTSKDSNIIVDTDYYETTDAEAKRGAGWVALRKIPEHESPDLTAEQRNYIDAYHASAHLLAQVKPPTRITIRTDGQPNWQNLQEWLKLVHRKEVAPLTQDDIDGGEHAGTVKAIFDSVVRYRPYPLKIALMAQDSWRAALADRDARWADITTEDRALAVIEGIEDKHEADEPVGLLTMGEEVDDAYTRDDSLERTLAEGENTERKELPFSTAPQEQAQDEYGSDVDEEAYTELESSAIKARASMQEGNSFSRSPSATPTPAPVRSPTLTVAESSSPSPSGPPAPEQHLSHLKHARLPSLPSASRAAKKSHIAVTPEKNPLDLAAHADRSRSAKTKGLSTLHGLMEDANDYALSLKKEKRVKEKGRKRKDREESPFRHGNPDVLDEETEGLVARKTGEAGPKRVKLGAFKGVGGYEPFGETVMGEVRDEEDLRSSG